jgi:molybdenum cofactor guanylyltransferase
MTPPTDTVLRPAAIAAALQGAARSLVPKEEITGVILAGGKGRRVGGQDKGLLQVDGRPLISHIVDRIRPQVGSLVINANRNVDSYRAFGHPVVQDRMGEFLGPLAGMASAMQNSDTPYLLSVPCDSPLVPADLCVKLYRTLKAANADIGVAHDGTRMQSVFVLLRRELLPDLLHYLDKGGRKIDTWLREQRLALADFSDRPDAFLNVNTCDELRTLEAAKRKA